MGRDSRGRFISSAGEYDAWARKRDDAINQRLKEGLEFVLDRTAQRMRETTGFRDQTGNLRSSIGVNVAVAAGSTPPAQTLEAKVLEGRVEGVLGIGMEYASHVNERTHFTEGAIAEAPKVADETFAGVLQLIKRDLA